MTFALINGDLPVKTKTAKFLFLPLSLATQIDPKETSLGARRPRRQSVAAAGPSLLPQEALVSIVVAVVVVGVLVVSLFFPQSHSGKDNLNSHERHVLVSKLRGAAILLLLLVFADVLV